MEPLARLRGVRVHRIDLPEPATREALIAAYDEALRKDLFQRERIFTVERDGPSKGACVRVTPSFWNTPADMDRLAAAIRARGGAPAARG